MGWFKKIFKGIGKAFKKVGKFIKKGFQKLGKFMNKLGIVGQIGMMFLTAGAANLVIGGLMKGLNFAATSTGMLGTVANGVLKAVTTVQKLGTGLKTAFKGTVGSIVKAVGNVVTPTMKAIGERLGMNFASPVLQSKGGAGLLDTIGQGIIEAKNYSADQFASLRAQGKGFFANTVVDPITGTTNISGDPQKYENILDINKPSDITTPIGAETRQSLLDLGGGASRGSNAFPQITEAEYSGRFIPEVSPEVFTPSGSKFSPYGAKVSPYGAKVSPYGAKVSPYDVSKKSSLLNVVPEVTKSTIGSSAQDMVSDLYSKAFSKDRFIDAATAGVTTSLTGLLAPPIEVEGGGQRFMGDSVNIGMEALATGGVTSPLQTAAFDYFNSERTNNAQANYFGYV